MSCDCIRSVLVLTDEERRALDEYKDDSIPPLSNVIERWKNALKSKGRIPFKAFPDDPFRAAYRGDVTAIRQFLEDGFSPNTGNEVGYTALMAAARGESRDVIRLLLAHGGKAMLADKQGYTALHWAVAQSTMNTMRQVACVCALLDAGADPNARNQDGITPLMNAAWFGCCDSVRELKRRGADPSLRDKENKTAAELASKRGHKEVADLLK